MYGKLWNFVNQYIDKEHALAVYLPILIVGWTIIGTVLGMGVCFVFSNLSFFLIFPVYRTRSLNQTLDVCLFE